MIMERCRRDCYRADTHSKIILDHLELLVGVLDIGRHNLGHNGLQIVHPFLVLLKAEIIHVLDETVVLLPECHLAWAVQANQEGGSSVSSGVKRISAESGRGGASARVGAEPQAAEGLQSRRAD